MMGSLTSTAMISLAGPLMIPSRPSSVVRLTMAWMRRILGVGTSDDRWGFDLFRRMTRLMTPNSARIAFVHSTRSILTNPNRLPSRNREPIGRTTGKGIRATRFTRPRMRTNLEFHGHSTRNR